MGTNSVLVKYASKQMNTEKQRSDLWLPEAGEE